MSFDKKTAFTPIKSRRTFEQVSNEIKKFIFDGIFKPGDKLPSEKELAQQFRVGRQSVREALRILELSGFIVIQKGGGGGAVIKDNISSTISGLFLDAFQLEKISIEELTVARVEIEKIVLKHAIQQAEPFDIERLRKNIADTRRKLETNKAAIDENIQFHHLLAHASKNLLFVVVVEAITTAVRHFLSQLNLENSLPNSESILRSKNTFDYHQRILDALIAKNTEEAVEWLEDHLNEVKTRLQRLSFQHTAIHLKSVQKSGNPSVGSNGWVKQQKLKD